MPDQTSVCNTPRSCGAHCHSRIHSYRMALRSPHGLWFSWLVSCTSVASRAHFPLSPTIMCCETHLYSPTMTPIIMSCNHGKNEPHLTGSAPHSVPGICSCYRRAARPFLLLVWVYTGGDLIWDAPLINFTISIMLLFALYLHSRHSAHIRGYDNCPQENHAPVLVKQAMSSSQSTISTLILSLFNLGTL